ncbi:hypothetical protein GGS20DRAFT_415942 [Poronia punctata]|nr:hypothetical protein GGS20DRAFT_415942 [Poronia punctata]
MEAATETMEPVMDFNDNLPELLAVDLEASSSIFESRHLTAGTPAPGLSDDGSKSHYSFQQDPGYLGPIFPDQSIGTLAGSESPETTIHQKYSDIFAPLDYSFPKRRASVSSSDCSADMEPPSLSTREESVLTVDTWLEPEKNHRPTLLQTSSTSEVDVEVSWIDLEDMSPVTERRRSSMTDFIEFTQQSRGSKNFTNHRTMSLDSLIADNESTSIKKAERKPSVCPTEIPQRRSSLVHQEAYLAAQQLAKYFKEEEDVFPGTPRFGKNSSEDDDSRLTYVGGTGVSYHESDIDPIARNTQKKQSPETRRVHSTHMKPTRKALPKANKELDDGPEIASTEVGFGEWLESDMTHVPCDDAQSPRPLPPNILETCQYYATNFPEPMLTCKSLLVDKIRELSQGIRYNTEDRRSPLAAPSNPSLVQHQPRLSRWKWLGNTGSKEQLQDPPEMRADTPPISNKFEWSVMRKIFPCGRDDLCEALYAYVLAYNYVTMLCRRLPLSPNTMDSSRPASPWTTSRPGTSSSGLSTELGMYDKGAARPSPCEASGVPRKAASILGMGEEGVSTPTSLVSPTRRSSRGSEGSRMSSYTAFRNNSPFFGGTGQWQQRHQHSESRSGEPKPMNGSGYPSLTRPATAAGYRPEQVQQLIELRHGLAMCCARLVITLHRANTKGTRRKEDRDCKVDPSFMQSLCENVRITEEAMGRSL